jgi:hypothetical protein
VTQAKISRQRSMFLGVAAMTESKCRVAGPQATRGFNVEDFDSIEVSSTSKSVEEFLTGELQSRQRGVKIAENDIVASVNRLSQPWESHGKVIIGLRTKPLCYQRSTGSRLQCAQMWLVQ